MRVIRTGSAVAWTVVAAVLMCAVTSKAETRPQVLACCCAPGPTLVTLTTSGTGQYPWVVNPAQVESIDFGEGSGRTSVRMASGETREVDGTPQQVAAQLGMALLPAQKRARR